MSRLPSALAALVLAACTAGGGAMPDAPDLDPRCPATPRDGLPCDPPGLACHYFEFDYRCSPCHLLYCDTVNVFGYCHQPLPDAGDGDAGIACPATSR